jgi:4-carboxymuconolactone decarboxylase
VIGAPVRDRKDQTMAEAGNPLRIATGELVPKIVDLTDDVLFVDVWLPKRRRSLVPVAALVLGGNTEQLEAHLQLARPTASPRPC